ncbi:glycosyltransferase [Streptomyces sp. NPDC003032]
MRILFTTWAPGSHLLPMLPLARACQTAGHEVRVAVLPSCVPTVRQAGLTPVPVGAEPGRGAASFGAGPAGGGPWPADWPLRVRELAPEQRALLDGITARQFATAEHMADEVTAYALRLRPDLVVHDAATHVGPLVASVLGVPSIAHLWGSAAVLRMDRVDLGDELRPEFRELYSTHGGEAGHEPRWWLDPCPPSLWLPVPGVRRVAAGFEPARASRASRASSALTATRSGRPRVCLIWPGPRVPGVVTGTAARLAARGVEVDLVLDPAAARTPGELPDGVRVVSGVPLDSVLAGAAAVVHPGDGPGVLAAARAGVPQLVLSPRPEQLVTGTRLAAAGAGLHRALPTLLVAEEPVRLVVHDVLELLESADARVAAERLRDEAAQMPGPAEAVALLSATAEEGAAARSVGHHRLSSGD